jgi:hypothetical protein
VTFPLFDALKEEYAYEAEHEQLNRFWTESGIPHLDLLGTYRGHRAGQLTVSPFDAHPNERAHAMAARAIGDFLEDLLEVRGE